jgi:hypothetical protein
MQDDATIIEGDYWEVDDEEEDQDDGKPGPPPSIGHG